LADKVRLLCYGFDPAQGIYTLSIHRLLVLVSLLGTAALAAVIELLLCREARAKA
jgi:protein SCO1/2